MTPGLGFALVAMAGYGAGDLIYKRAAATGIESRSFIMMQSWVYSPSTTLFALATGTLVIDHATIWALLAGLFSLTAFYNFARSLHGGSVSTNAPIFRLNFTLTAALAIILLGEPLTGAKLAGLACALGAVWLLLFEPSAAVRPSLSSLTRVLIATVAMAVANLFFKIGLSAGATPETMVAAQSWVFCSLATLSAWLPKRQLRWTPGTWRHAVPVGLLLLIATLMLMHGLLVGQASVLVPIGQMGFVFTAVLGAALFHEPLNRRKQIGLVFAAAALALFAVS